MEKAFEQMMQFMKKNKQYIGTIPIIPPREVERLRMKLLQEEFKELLKALESWDRVGIADGCADLIYVTIGLCVSYGIYLPDIWEAVHKANMSKKGKLRADGKTMKHKGFKHPDIEGILRKQDTLEE